MEESSDHKRITKKLSYQPPKRRYHILSSIKKGRRKTCPEIFSKEGDSDEKVFTQIILFINAYFIPIK